MPMISISIISDGIPVDKMQDGDGGGPSCPIATKDAEANLEAKEVAI